MTSPFSNSLALPFTLLRTENKCAVNVLFCPVFCDIRKSFPLPEGSQISSSFSSHKNSIKKKMTAEHTLNVTEGEKPKYSKQNLCLP
jgi:hypothetical protein